MNRPKFTKWAVAGSTGTLMIIVVIIVALRKSRGVGGEFALALLLAILPPAIFAFTPPDRRRVLVYGTVHAALMVGLALLYLIGAGPSGFVYAFLIYFVAVATSIVAVAGR